MQQRFAQREWSQLHFCDFPAVSEQARAAQLPKKHNFADQKYFSDQIYTGALRVPWNRTLLQPRLSQ